MKIRYHGNRPSSCAPAPATKMGRASVMPRIGHLALLCAPLLACAHSVTRGLEVAQTGLGVVDVATEELSKAYVQAIDLCQQTHRPACDRLGDPETVSAKAEALGKAYDATAEGLAEMESAWAEVAPHFEAALEVVREAAR